MHLCDDGHDEVVYDGRDCPVCEKIKDMQSDIDSLGCWLKEMTEERDQLVNRLTELEDKIIELQSKGNI